jgi:acetolactate synthase-1/2/3 large subunit
MSKKQQLKASQVILKNLEKYGVKYMFGYTGGAIMPTFDELPNYNIKFITTRHEQGAGFMAQGYTRASGKLAPVLVTSGPGATNTITAIADAKMDSVPMLVISGQVATPAIGSDAFQESDIIGMMYSCTKYALMPMHADEVALNLGQLLAVATHGRPGPVALDIPKDVQNQLTEKTEIPEDLDLKGLAKVPKPDLKKIEKAAKMIAESKKPVILLGHGIILSNSQKEILEFLNKTQIPAGMTLHGISSVPASHPLNLGMIGQHGEIEANRVIQKADLVIALGMRFDDRVTGKLEEFCKNAKIIHIEIDPSEINKNVKVDLAICSDLKLALQELNKKVKQFPIYDPTENYLKSAVKQGFETNEIIQARNQTFEEIKENKILSSKCYKQIFNSGYGPNGRLLMARIMHELSEFTKGKDNIVADVGQHQMFAAKFYKYERFNTWFNSGGLGTMGFALPASIGVKLARPDEEVWSVNGDGGFQMNIQELGVMLQEKLNINILILNNEYLGMVKQWQNLFFKDNLVETELLHNPKFDKIAEAYGLAYRKVEKLEEIIPALKWAKEESLPTIVEFMCDKAEHVYPMISSGMSYEEMIINEEDAKLKLGLVGGGEAPG